MPAGQDVAEREVAERDVAERSAAERARPSSPQPPLRQAQSLLASLRRRFARSWLLELAVLVSLAFAYNVVRGLPHTSRDVAVQHAYQIVSFEGAVFDLIEDRLNTWLGGLAWLAIVACYVYAVLHYLVTPAVLILSRRRGGAQYWRGYWSLVLATGIAVAGYAFYPVAPPRLVPKDGIVDVMREYAYAGWWGGQASAPHGLGDATNQFAALPSMHFGWALWCGILMWGFGSRVWRVLAVTYPALVAFVVLSTGNHYVVDVLAGGVCVLVAYAVVYIVSTRIWQDRRDQAKP